MPREGSMHYFSGSQNTASAVPPEAGSCLAFSGNILCLEQFISLGRDGVFLERFHYKEVNFSRNEACNMVDICIRKEYAICTAAW